MNGQVNVYIMRALRGTNLILPSNQESAIRVMDPLFAVRNCKCQASSHVAKETDFCVR